MITRNPVLGPSETLVIFQVREPARLSPETDPLRKDTGKEKRIIPHVHPDEKAGAIIGGFKRAAHIRKRIQPVGLARNKPQRASTAAEFATTFSTVICNGPVRKDV